MKMNQRSGIFANIFLTIIAIIALCYFFSNSSQAISIPAKIIVP